MLRAIAKEIGMRKSELINDTVSSTAFLSDRAEPRADKLETIYFGGGTPSLLTDKELGMFFDTIAEHFEISHDAEITLEGNPDDLTGKKIKELAHSPVNRLSIGIQSFRDRDLTLMNRAHNAEEAERSIKASQDAGITNITADLIYGLPDQSLVDWRENILKLISFDVPHLSSYCLTIEPKTALAHFVRKGKVRPAGEQMSSDHFRVLVEETTKAGYEHYEISNFAKPGFIAIHNSSYWKGEPYLGVGPSAHSFSGNERRWNVANNSVYMKKILSGDTAYESEILSEKSRYNERIMLGLRAKWGVDMENIRKEFGDEFSNHLKESMQKHISTGHLALNGTILQLTQEGKFLSDGIASDLFLV